MPDINEGQGSGTDFFGIKPLAKSVEIATQGAVDVATALIERICFPASKEFGLLLKDKVHAYRAKHITAVAQKANEKMNANGVTAEMHASPRIVNAILENSSWIEDAAVQDMWAGLLSSSCTDNGDDDSNLIFTNLLASCTRLQARILKEICENAHKSALGELIYADSYSISVEKLCEVSKETDMQRLDRELDHLRELGLITGGLLPHQNTLQIGPTPLALHMFVRCQGSRMRPIDYFKVAPVSRDATQI